MTTAAELTGATQAQVAAARAALAAYVQPLYPTLAVQVGPLADLVLGPAGDALAAVDVRATATVASLDPATALATGVYDPTVLAAVLAGRGVTRIPASAASGTVALVLTTSTPPRTVPAGFKLTTADGVVYQTTATVQLLPPGSTPQANAVVLVAVGVTGPYVGLVPIAAATTGAAGNRPAGTALTATSPLPTQTAAYAATDLAGGADAETDAALLARLPAATAPRTTATAAGAQAVLQAAVPVISAVTAFGFGDPGMLRGQSTLSLQTPGRLDLRVRVGSAPGRTAVPVTATYTGPVGPYGGWQFVLPAAAAPGWFVVEKVLQATALLTAAGYAPTATAHGFDPSVLPPYPDIRSAADAAFSGYATAVVRFTDPDTPTAGLTPGVSTRAYAAVVRDVPGIAAGQTAVNAPAVRTAGGDCLVRSACPVLVRVTARATPAAGVTLTPAQVAAAVARAVNGTGLGATLSGPQVAASALSYLPAGTSIQLSSWSGTLYRIDGATTPLTGTSGLAAATDWSGGVGDGNVAYYADPEAVAASVG